MKHKSTSVLWMSVAFGVAVGLAAAVLVLKGIDKKSMVLALQITARWSFLLFWLAYAGGAMTSLFGPVFEPLARRGRDFGLAYAAAQLIHLGLVAWLFKILSHLPLSGEGLALFSIAIVWTYVLVIFSFGLSKALGSTGWRALRIFAMNYILFAFAIDFVPGAIRDSTHYQFWHVIAYAPFAAMSIVAPLLVLAASARHLGMRYTHAIFGPVAN